MNEAKIALIIIIIAIILVPVMIKMIQDWDYKKHQFDEKRSFKEEERQGFYVEEEKMDETKMKMDAERDRLHATSMQNFIGPK